MEILEMIEEWRKGCTCSTPEHPEDCVACTLGLITAIENKEKIRAFSGCISPKFYLIVDRLRDIASSHPKDKNQTLHSTNRIVDRNDLLAMLHEFFRLDGEIRRLRPDVRIDKEEEYRVC